MFGYVRIDKANMLIKDFALYRAFYCGLCHSLKRNYSYSARLFTTYDLTFFAVLLHSAQSAKSEYEMRACILNPVRKRPIVKSSELLDTVADVAVLMAAYKFNDDLTDCKDKKALFAKRMYRSEIKRAKSKQVAVAAIIDEKLALLNGLEKDRCPSVDRVADCFADMNRTIFKLLCGEKYNSSMGEYLYAVTRWIYIADALDDIDDDIKSGNYNPFLIEYPSITDKKALLLDKKTDIEYIMDSAYSEICRHYKSFPSNSYEGVLTNITWYGILHMNDKLLGRLDCSNCLSDSIGKMRI